MGDHPRLGSRNQKGVQRREEFYALASTVTQGTGPFMCDIFAGELPVISWGRVS
jgi:hypothetical protein